MSLGQIKRTKEIQGGEKADIFNIFMICSFAETNYLRPRKESPSKLSAAFFYHAGGDHTSNFFWVMSLKNLPGKDVKNQVHAIGVVVWNCGQFDIDS